MKKNRKRRHCHSGHAGARGASAGGAAVGEGGRYDETEGDVETTVVPFCTGPPMSGAFEVRRWTVRKELLAGPVARSAPWQTTKRERKRKRIRRIERT